MTSQFVPPKASTYLSKTLTELITTDPLRLEVLRIVKQIGLADGWVAAGFVRNLVWDHLHRTSTPLTDIDVIYFDAENCLSEADLEIENQLKRYQPKLPWSVKNQARMHLKNGDLPYRSCFHAMSYWPEKQTAIAARLDANNDIQLMHCFSLETLFSKKISHNPIREKAIFEQRVTSKKWLKNWCQLTVD